MNQLRKCTSEDLELLQKISIETYSDTFGAYNTGENMAVYLKEAYNREKLAKELVNPLSQFYFIYEDTQLAGYMKLNSGDAQTEPIDKNALEVERIYIRAAFKRKGLGKKLIETAVKTANAQKKTSIWLGVWEKNDAAKVFYEKMGFLEYGSHDFYMGDDKQTDLILLKQLAS
ncbi:GNAT family N-acetyltransferase [Enterococcus sp. LJL51]|uniref:GNAT family N-acetyltransferase n=1 Tax=Enterococcus sp. LJL51 TaxID=3416656 RepID=UPI003CE6C834